jgi:hypothetical protein
MIKFIAPHYRRYPVSAHIGYHQVAQNIINDTSGGALKSADAVLTTLWNTHNGLLADERTMETFNEKELNAQINEADVAMCNRLSVVRSLLDVSARTAATAEAAVNIKAFLKELGDIAHKPVATRESDVLTFCFACSPGGELHADATACGINPAVAALGELRGVLRVKLDRRRNFEESRPATSTQEVRKMIDANLSEMFIRIEGLQDFGATPAVRAAAEACTRDVNAETETINKRYDRKLKNIKHHVVANFPTEAAATGKPVTPLPEGPVWYEVYNADKVLLEKTELFLGHDIQLSYRNNVKPGKAYILVHGKGDYTGTEEFPFVIV